MRGTSVAEMAPLQTRKQKGPANRAGPCVRDVAELLRSAAGPEGRDVALHQGHVVGSWLRIVFLGLTLQLRNLADHATTNSAGCLFQGRVGVDERVRDRRRSWILDGKEQFKSCRYQVDSVGAFIFQ